MKILIITACTGKKKVGHPSSLKISDFFQGDEHIKRCEKKIADLMCIAENLYTGQQHVRLMRGVEYIRDQQLESNTDWHVDLRILSAGYGLIESNREIAPYECTFQGMKTAEILALAEKRHIPEDFKKTVARHYDLGLILLGDGYLKACQIDSEVEWGGPTILFCGKEAAKRLPKDEKLKIVPASNAEAKRFSCGLVGLKGELASRVLHRIKDNPVVLSQLIDAKSDVLPLLDQPLAKPELSKRDTSPATEQPVIHIPYSWKKKSQKNKMRYFIPEWDDLVNPNYDFITDTHPPGTGDAYEHALYAHQIFEEPPYDGILVSKVVVEGKKRKKELLTQLGVHQYLRVPRTFPVMGDCGAFGYIMEDDPPYDTEEILDYYESLDFDYGVSIDHLIVPGALKKDTCYAIQGKSEPKEISAEEYKQLNDSGRATEIKSAARQLSLFDDNQIQIFKNECIDENKRQYRYDLTIRNAREFIEKHKAGNYSFTPIGAVQGWSPESYAHAVKEYQKMGYTYIALGGLVRSQTKTILEILEAVNKVLKPGVGLHLFGVARPNALEDMYRLGVRSIDSASFLRRAWLGATSNYFTPTGNYAAIRVPQAGKSFRAKRIVQEGKASLEELQQLEKKCIDLLRAYDRGEIEMEPVLDAVMTYDDWMGENRNGHRELFKKTLEERPWQKCKCRICREKGIDVIIFRGNNRNRRRGFHNTKIFYDQFCQMFGEK